MAIVRTDDTHYAAIAEALRQNLGSTAKFTPAQMPAGVAEVFEAGKAAGGGSGDNYYDTFWDRLQINGTLTEYEYLFRGYQWGAKNFYPKYDIRPVGSAYRMFYTWSPYASKYTDIEPLDLAQRLQDCGVVLDTSGATQLANCFRYSTLITRVPAIDVTGVTTSPDHLFSDSGIETIDKIIISATTPCGPWFYNAKSLKNVTFEGVIGSSGFNFTQSTLLTHDSIMSVINALETKTSGTWTVTFGTTNLAKLTAAEKKIATDKGWTLA